MKNDSRAADFGAGPEQLDLVQLDGQQDAPGLIGKLQVPGGHRVRDHVQQDGVGQEGGIRI